MQREGVSSFVCSRLRFTWRRNGFLRRCFAFSPDCSAGKKFLLPDWYSPLQSVNRIAARIERNASVCRTDRNPYAGFANLETSEPVDNGYAMDGKFVSDLRADLAHFAQRHRFVSFILQVQRAVSLKIVAHKAVENH